MGVLGIQYPASLTSGRPQKGTRLRQLRLKTTFLDEKVLRKFNEVHQQQKHKRQYGEDDPGGACG